MAIQVTAWRPDTHSELLILYSWEDQEPEDTRVHTPILYADATEVHIDEAAIVALPDLPSQPALTAVNRIINEQGRKALKKDKTLLRSKFDAFNQVHMRKNLGRQDVIAALPASAVNSDADGNRTPKAGFEPAWEIAADGTVTFDVPALTRAQDRVAVAAALAAKHGNKAKLKG